MNTRKLCTYLGLVIAAHLVSALNLSAASSSGETETQRLLAQFSAQVATSMPHTKIEPCWFGWSTCPKAMPGSIADKMTKLQQAIVLQGKEKIRASVGSTQAPSAESVSIVDPGLVRRCLEDVRTKTAVLDTELMSEYRMTRLQRIAHRIENKEPLSEGELKMAREHIALVQAPTETLDKCLIDEQLTAKEIEQLRKEFIAENAISDPETIRRVTTAYSPTWWESAGTLHEKLNAHIDVLRRQPEAIRYRIRELRFAFADAQKGLTREAQALAGARQATVLTKIMADATSEIACLEKMHVTLEAEVDFLSKNLVEVNRAMNGTASAAAQEFVAMAEKTKLAHDECLVIAGTSAISPLSATFEAVKKVIQPTDVIGKLVHAIADINTDGKAELKAALTGYVTSMSERASKLRTLITKLQAAGNTEELKCAQALEKRLEESADLMHSNISRLGKDGIGKELLAIRQGMGTALATCLSDATKTDVTLEKLLDPVTRSDFRAVLEDPREIEGFRKIVDPGMREKFSTFLANNLADNPVKTWWNSKWSNNVVTRSGKWVLTAGKNICTDPSGVIQRRWQSLPDLGITSRAGAAVAAVGTWLNSEWSDNMATQTASWLLRFGKNVVTQPRAFMSRRWESLPDIGFIAALQNIRAGYNNLASRIDPVTESYLKEAGVTFTLWYFTNKLLENKISNPVLRSTIAVIPTGILVMLYKHGSSQTS